MVQAEEGAGLMASEKVSFTRLSCDRCNFVKDVKTATDSSSWGTVTAQGSNGSPGLDLGYKGDLCPGCYSAFISWWNKET